MYKECNKELSFEVVYLSILYACSRKDQGNIHVLENCIYLGYPVRPAHAVQTSAGQQQRGVRALSIIQLAQARVEVSSYVQHG
jgi:hypothetical protein